METPQFKFIDLHLPSTKTPLTTTIPQEVPLAQLFDRYCAAEAPPTPAPFGQPRAKAGPALGPTTAVGSKGSARSKGDFGLFGPVFEAWACHLNLRTTPEDWWLPVVTRIAARIDEHAERPELRELLVGGRKGKEEITVEVESFSIHTTDYSALFAAFSAQIQQRTTAPGYVESIRSDFSTSTPDQRIAAQIALMKSVQKYFDYTMGIMGCGVRAVEMGGTELDWARLLGKLTKLTQLLAPVQHILQLGPYLDFCEGVFYNLLKTFIGDEDMSRWWAGVLMESKEWEYGPSGMRKGQVEAYNGWLVRLCTGAEVIKASSIRKTKELACWSACPLKIVDHVRNVSDTARLAAGILGFVSHEDAPNGVLSIQPAHGWALMLPVNSKLRV